MSSWEDRIEEVRKLFNHICIVHDYKLIRMVGISQDFMDVYYVGMDPDGGLGYYTFVGSCESLKDNFPRYAALENHFTLNRCPPQDEFQITIGITCAANTKFY